MVSNEEFGITSRDQGQEQNPVGPVRKLEGIPREQEDRQAGAQFQASDGDLEGSEQEASPHHQKVGRTHVNVSDQIVKLRIVISIRVHQERNALPAPVT